MFVVVLSELVREQSFPTYRAWFWLLSPVVYIAPPNGLPTQNQALAKLHVPKPFRHHTWRHPLILRIIKRHRKRNSITVRTTRGNRQSPGKLISTMKRHLAHENLENRTVSDNERIVLCFD